MQQVADQAFVVQLGGAEGQQKSWGCCLAARADAVAHLRSQLGHELASRSAARGLEPIGLVAYIEVSVASVVSGL